MLGDEFFKQRPLAQYHGTHHQDGSVFAKFTNLRISDKMFVISESALFDSVVKLRKHLRIWHQDNYNAASLSMRERALSDLQNDKRQSGLDLDCMEFSRIPKNGIIPEKLEAGF